MSDFRPDNMIPDPRDRLRSGRSGSTSQEPQLNLGNLDLPLDAPESNNRQPTTTNNTVNEAGSGGSIERPSGQKRSNSSNKGYVFSRQRLIMGVAILILIVVIMLLALTPQKSDNTADKSPSVAEKSIDLGTALSGEQKTDTTTNNPQFYSSQPDSNTSIPDQQQPLSPPPVASAPLQNNTVDTTAPQQQTQLTLQGDLNNVLVPQQPVNGNIAANEPTVTHNPRAKPTGAADKPATSLSQPNDALRHNVTEPKKTASKKAETSKSTSGRHSAGGSVSHSLTLSSLKSAPTSYYTVQLSSGSSENNLRQWAQKNGVKNYLVYKTTRNNQPWYVLISGLYPSRAAAKQSLPALPASVQAKSPWLKPVRLAQDELKQ